MFLRVAGMFRAACAVVLTLVCLSCRGVDDCGSQIVGDPVFRDERLPSACCEPCRPIRGR